MYRVMIVDDEPLIRRGLRETIEWDVLGLEVAGEVCNGQEALESMEKIKPHIIITDVKMPIMDGINLIKTIHALNIKVKIIILSGYNEYEYLKEAIKYNVESYLLKPIDQNELLAILKSTILTIEKEFDIELQNRQGIQALRNSTLNRLITNNISLKELKEKSRMFHILLNNHHQYGVWVGVIDSYVDSSTEIWEQDNYLKLFGVVNICEEIITGDIGIVFTDNDGRLIIIAENSNKKVVERAIKEVMQKVYEYLGISLFIGVGNKMPLDQLYKSYNTAIECLEYGIITGNDNIIYARDMKESKVDGSSPIDYDVMKGLIISMNGDKLAEYIKNYITCLSERNIHIDDIRSSVIEIVIYVTRIMDDVLFDKKAKLKGLKIEYSKLMKINRLDGMIQWLTTYCNQVITNIGNQLNQNGSRLIQDVVEYSHLNYYKNISLKKLSEMFDINTSYLGQLFKKEIGTSFAEYINQYRIKKAIDYLMHSNMKVYEIGEEVGYTNYQYFIKIFKKYTGCTPSDYK